MTSDRAAKKVARARMAATGESYSAARRAGRTGPGEPAELADPPAIDPREHALRTHYWGVLAVHLVGYQGRYYAWFTAPGAPERVYPMSDEETGRHFVDICQAQNLLRTGWDEQIAHLFLSDPASGARPIYQAAVLSVADSGIWLACVDDTTDDQSAVTLSRFGDVGDALEEFAARAEQAAGQVERGRAIGSPELIAAVLRYRAAQARADAGRVIVGDVLRRSAATAGHSAADIGRSHGLRPLLSEAGLSREDLPPVLADQTWTWRQAPVVRPPGARLPDTPAAVLGRHTVDGQSFALVSYQDTAGHNFVAIECDGPGAGTLRDLQVDDQHLVAAGLSMATRGRGTAAVYGRVHDSVTGLYALMKDGSRADWPIRDDPRSQERYFAVIADCDALADIVAVAPGAGVSLKDFFGIWFSKPPGRKASGRDRGGRRTD